MASSNSAAAGGIDPFGAVRWDLEAGATALVLIDLQRDFLHPDGWYAQSGVDIAHMRRVIAPTQRLLVAARAAEVPIVWTRHGFRGAEDAGPFFELRPFLRDGGLRLDTWGFDLHDDLDVRPEDWVTEKNRLSAFYETKLDLVLRGLGARTVLIGGVLTNQCVAATSKDAMFRDYRPIVVEECTGTTLPHLHEPALEMMRVGWAEVRGLDDVLGELAALRPAAAGQARS